MRLAIEAWQFCIANLVRIFHPTKRRGGRRKAAVGDNLLSINVLDTYL